MSEHFESLRTNETELTAALERKPAVRVPADFAARVAAKAVVLPASTRRRPMSYGMAATGIAAALLLLAMFALARSVQPSFTSLSFDLELVLLTELLGIGAWLTVRHRA